MLRPFVGVLALILSFAGLFGGPAFAQTAAPFNLPPPWSRKDVDPPAGDTTRKMSQWHIVGESDTFTLVDDTTAVYTDALATIEKNFTDNKMKPSINKDVTCAGKAGHMVEFSAGPATHQLIINRLLLPDSPAGGVTTFTYLRSDKDWDPMALKAMTSYCGASPI